MPLRIETVTLHFKDEAGQEVPDATYTIRRRLSRDGQMAYLKSAARFNVEVDEETGEPRAGFKMTDLDIKAVTDPLLQHGLVSLSGVLDANGDPLPVERFGEFDAEYVQQVVAELQRRNSGEGTSPNGAALPAMS